MYISDVSYAVRVRRCRSDGVTPANKTPDPGCRGPESTKLTRRAEETSNAPAARPPGRGKREVNEIYRDKTAKLVHVLDAPRLAPVLSRAPGRALPGTGRAVVRVEIKPGTNMHR